MRQLYFSPIVSESRSTRPVRQSALFFNASLPKAPAKPVVQAPRVPRMLYWEQIDPTSNSLYPLD